VAETGACSLEAGTADLHACTCFPYHKAGQTRLQPTLSLRQPTSTPLIIARIGRINIAFLGGTSISLRSFLFMSFWGKKGRNAPTIRIEKVAAPSQPLSLKKTVPAKQNQNQPRPTPNRAESRRADGSLTPQPDSRASTPLESRKRVDSRKRSPAFQRVESDSEDDGSLVRFDSISSKKAKTVANATADLRRHLRALQTFSDEDRDVLINAAHIASVKHKFPPAFNASPEEICVELHYPGSAHPERYVGCQGYEVLGANSF
jgi:hypothetical protein